VLLEGKNEGKKQNNGTQSQKEILSYGIHAAMEEAKELNKR